MNSNNTVDPIAELINNVEEQIGIAIDHPNRDPNKSNTSIVTLLIEDLLSKMIYNWKTSDVGLADITILVKSLVVRAYDKALELEETN